MTGLEAAAARDTQVITLQNRLLDHSGHVRTGLSPARARRLATQVNALRAANGWGPLDMRRRWRTVRD